MLCSSGRIPEKQISNKIKKKDFFYLGGLWPLKNSLRAHSSGCPLVKQRHQTVGSLLRRMRHKWSSWSEADLIKVRWVKIFSCWKAVFLMFTGVPQRQKKIIHKREWTAVRCGCVFLCGVLNTYRFVFTSLFKSIKLFSSAKVQNLIGRLLLSSVMTFLCDQQLSNHVSRSGTLCKHR